MAIGFDCSTKRKRYSATKLQNTGCEPVESAGNERDVQESKIWTAARNRKTAAFGSRGTHFSNNLTYSMPAPSERMRLETRVRANQSGQLRRGGFAAHGAVFQRYRRD